MELLFHSVACLAFLLLPHLSHSLVRDASQFCGDSSWSLYKDSKCLKIIDTFVTSDSAAQLCQLESTNARLLTIGSGEEQNAFTKFIFEENQILDNAWLGIRRKQGNGNETSREFVYDDGSLVQFSNWAQDHPGDDGTLECAQLTSRTSREFGDFTSSSKTPSVSAVASDGLWKATACLKRNLVVCQKAPTWSLAQLQQELIKLRENPVPIGFIYTEYPRTPDPWNLWPGVTWTEITANFAGLFFRAAGGGSAAFGQTQEDSTRQITQTSFTSRQGQNPYANPLLVPKTGWSDFGDVGFDDTGEGGTYYRQGLRFLTSDTEVRPKNTAVRIWQRTA